MLLKLLISVFLLSLVSARTQLDKCLDDDKYCVGLPRGCLGPQCLVAFSSKSNGTHAEIEILGTNILDKTWLGIAYSSDKEMKDDIVVYCIREDKEFELQSMAGLAYNTDHLNEMLGSVKELKASPKKDRFKLDLNIVEHDKNDKGLYCKLTHRVDTIMEHFNMTKLEILVAKGVWMPYGLSYHGRTRNYVGVVDLSGAPKRDKKKSASVSTALLSSAVTFLAAKLFVF